MVVCSAVVSDLFSRDGEALAAVRAATDKPVVFCAYTNINPEIVTCLSAAGFLITNSFSNAALVLRCWADYCAFLEARPCELHPDGPPAPDALMQGLARAPVVCCEHPGAPTPRRRRYQRGGRTAREERRRGGL